LEQLQLAEELNPQDPKVHNVLGILYKRQNNMDKAKEHFLKVNKLLNTVPYKHTNQNNTKKTNQDK
jgi:Flp pilus assembly protein TadD